MSASVEDRLAVLEGHTRALHDRLERVEAELHGRAAAPARPAAAPPPLTRPAPAAPPPRPAVSRPLSRPQAPTRAGRELDLEELLGGRLLALVGGLAVLLGLAFLVALAI